MKKKPKIIDLFCGCGGLSYGFAKAGYEVILGIDNDKQALVTFEKNHNGANSIAADVSKNNFIKQIKTSVSDNNIDVIIAGPPCQGFSLTGPRNFDDKRNTLYLSVIKAVKYFKPKAFLIENVPGLATLYGGEIKDEIIRRLESIGYKVSMKILCAADYGVPQLRKRVFFVGLRNGYGKFEFPKQIHATETFITCSDAISDLADREDDLGEEVEKYSALPVTKYQEDMRNGSSLLYNHVATKHTEIVKSVISLVPQGCNYKSLPPGIGTSRRFNEAWTRYHGNKPSRTIDTGHRNHFHYKHNRIPTVRENARLQSFPDTFIFYGTRTQQNRQVGNAVPPLLAYHIAKKLLKYIKKK